MKKYKCVAKCEFFGVISPCETEIDDCLSDPCRCVQGGRFCEWKKISADTPPKLTAEELAKRGIEWPEWAGYAALTSYGSADFFETEPKRSLINFCPEIGSQHCGIPGKWDASDWKNSLIRRPENKLPDWCKVGAWCWTERTGYFTITEIEGGECICGKSPNGEGQTVLNEKISEARVCPWTHMTIPNLPFAVNLKFSSHFTDTITTCSLSGVWFARHSREMVAFSALMDIAIQLDGFPCGCLEHREGEGWVR